MRKVYLSAGHTNVVGLDRGATGCGFIEGNLTVEVRDLIARELELLGIKATTEPNRSALAETIALFKNLVGSRDIAIDIHFNAASPSATGTEVFIPNDSTSFERQLASALAQAMASALTIRNRGVKPESDSARKKLGWMGIPCENILLEICFITNESDMRLYQVNRVKLAKSLALVIRDYVNK